MEGEMLGGGGGGGGVGERGVGLFLVGRWVVMLN